MSDTQLAIGAVTKDCANDCNLTIAYQSKTTLGWSPSYNKEGVQTNQDPNTTTTTIKCSVCDKSWMVKTARGRVFSMTRV